MSKHNPDFDDKIHNSPDSEYINKRLDKQQKYFSKKSAAYKKRFMIINMTTMSISAAIPVLTFFVDLFPFTAKLVIAILGGLSSVLSGYLTLSNINSLFIEYRMTSEKLKALKFMFITRTPPFDKSDAFEKLVIECEDVIYNENDKWYSFFKSEQEAREKANQIGS